MKNFNETTDLSQIQLEFLDAIQPSYGVAFSGGSFSVTPEAHEYYEFVPAAQVVAGGIPRKSHKDQRSPRIDVILTAPHEVTDTNLPHESAFYRRAGAVCTVWMTHPETRDQYVADGLARDTQAFRHAATSSENLSDEETLSTYLSDTNRARLVTQLRRGQLADMLNAAEPVIMNQIAFQRETSYAMDNKRRELLRTRGTHIQTRNGDGSFVHELVTTEAISEYSCIRARRTTSAIYGMYYKDDFSLRATSFILKG